MIDVKNFALQSLCKVFCKNKSEVPLQFGYFAHVIRIISASLSSGISSTVSIIIESTKRIFTLDYDGLLVLIPIYLKQIKNVLKPGKEFNKKVKSAAISILGSLLCIPDRYPNYTIPSIIGGIEKMTMDNAKKSIYEQIINFLKNYSLSSSNEEIYYKMINKAVCCASVIIYQEISNPNPQIDIVKV